ncbi:MAG: TolC family protein [Candidatus Eisenbacteria bacterium]|uniref:TolC family protein n=1 Tax=Eiseniibacteriota bacterium TaxID=2212470 RepID=A0A933SAR8_UNCEI|nr:TolC family protein [Candidatus Eisenbacteria bacterium]
MKHPRPMHALLAATLAASALVAPAGARAAETLDALVREALAANRDLRAERLQLEQARAAVSEATALFLPTVTVNARLSGRSGNVVDFGKLINPAFAALNQLTGGGAFPTDLRLVQPSKQETSVRVAMPLLDARLVANRRIRSGLRDAQRGATGAAARRIAAETRTGYLQYARALRLTALYDSTLVLVDEAVRVQESLLANGKATPDQVLRARADRSDVAQRRAAAARLADAARQLLNVRLGRAVDAPLEPIADDALGLELRVPLDEALASAREHREELVQARGGVRAAGGAVSLANAGYLPSLVAAVDWGVQGEEYRFERGEDYRVASLALQWTLFNGGQREAQRQAAAAGLRRARTLADEAAAKVELDARTAWQAAAVAREALPAAHERLVAARRTWELVAKRHAIGAASLLELLDARTNWTNAALNDVFTTYDYRERCAELDRAAALPSGLAGAEGGL